MNTEVRLHVSDDQQQQHQQQQPYQQAQQQQQQSLQQQQQQQPHAQQQQEDPTASSIHILPSYSPTSAQQQQDPAAAEDKLPRYIQVSSVLEFARMVCALERTPRISFLHNYGGQKILSAQMDILKEKPIVYYTPMDSDGQYVCYGLKDGREQVSIVDSTSDASKLYSPIVRIKSLPRTLRPGNGTRDRYQPIELEDVSSLAKLTWMGWEEAPFPLFLFPHEGSWLLGIFTTFHDEGTSYFCHIVLDRDPEKPFLKFSTANGSTLTFVDDPSEHGYSYIKIIKLKDTHPLVDYDGRVQG